MKKETEEEVNNYIEIYSKLIQAIPDKEVALEVIKEIGLTERTKLINEINLIKLQQPATAKQLDYIKILKDKGVIKTEIPKTLTKAEAGVIIEEAIEKEKEIERLEDNAIDY